MKRTLENLLERAAHWPEEAQAELVEAMVAIEAKHTSVYRLTDDERLAIRRGLQEMRDGKLATDEQVARVLDAYR
jgi:hypothetical protein